MDFPLPPFWPATVSTDISRLPIKTNVQAFVPSSVRGVKLWSGCGFGFLLLVNPICTFFYMKVQALGRILGLTVLRKAVRASERMNVRARVCESAQMRCQGGSDGRRHRNHETDCARPGQGLLVPARSREHHRAGVVAPEISGAEVAEGDLGGLWPGLAHQARRGRRHVPGGRGGVARLDERRAACLTRRATALSDSGSR